MAKLATILFLLCAALFLANVPGVHAACSDPPSANVDWSGCDLSGDDYTFANLAGADLTNAIIDGTIFDFANLAGADMTGATGTPIMTLPTGVASLTCPDGEGASVSVPYCDWQPVAVSLLGASATPAASNLPWLVAGILLALTAGLLWKRQRAAIVA